MKHIAKHVLKYVVSEKLTYYDFAYYLLSRQGAEDPQGFQVEAHGVYLIKVDNWPMSLAPMIEELAWLAGK